MLKLVDFVLKKMEEENKKVEMILLSGSRLNNLHLEDSDYDLFIITESTLDELLNTNARYSTTKKLGHFENVEVEAKIMSMVKFFEVIKKTNFNTLELFTAQPMYLNDDSIKLFRLFTKPYQRAMCNNNVERMISSVSGYAKANLKKMSTNKNKWKDTVQCFKGYEYLKQITLLGYIYSNDMSALRPVKFNVSNNFKESDLVSMNKFVIRQCEELSKELENKPSTMIDKLLLEMMCDKFPFNHPSSSQFILAV